MASVAQAVDIEQVGEDTFRSPVVPSRIERTFGGQTMAQALQAAQRTVEDKLAHSLHCYFVGPGDSSQSATLHVERVRDGRSFATRHVRVFKTSASSSFSSPASIRVETLVRNTRTRCR